ncbi:phage Gp37/Gp68 family protein, partial [Mesorhizobium sp. M2A.F.Ca.ET.039.01.1.1]|uniref:phage Gp37/Gp68 family protein n=1 Tax=Mesorhizobium sp. M2A.F.Ca.ET.039.01.1.1 TaxID=2496746 RepID=UPI000FF0628E
MADKSPIEWTDATWNPIVGCSIATAGCTHCYAMKMAARIEAMTRGGERSEQGSKKTSGAPHYAGTTKKVNGNAVWTGKLALAPERILTQPLRWKEPRRIFVNSMGDLFHEDVPDEWIDQTFAVMAVTPHHTYQPLTKRADRARRYISDPATKHRVYDLACNLVIERQIQIVLIAPDTDERQAPPGPRVYLDQWPLPNVWLGVSAERQQEADERIPELLATPAAIRFVSAEPLLGPIDFERIKLPGIVNPLDALRGMTWQQMTHGRYAGQRLYSGLIFGGDRGLDWIIVGGESGADARPMHPAWPRSIRDQCQAAGVPFFFKQWG